MFGYVVLNKPEIKFKDFDMYRSFYCGLCRELRERYGISGQITLSYDMTFVILLLSALYEPPTRKGTTRCIVHPVRKQTVRKNAITEYGADMNIFLTYYKCKDDWNDEKKILSLAYGKLLESKEKKSEQQWKKKIDVIISCLNELSEMEQEGETDIDRVSGCFGRIMAEIFAYREDVWEPTLRRMGFYLGKFIYLMDAYDDVEKDIKSGSYNPFKKAYLDDPAFADDCRSLLTLMMSECSREFEQLPILLHAEILRNVLYSGVWSRYTAVTSERLAGKNTHNAADTADGNSTAGRTTNDNPHPDTDNSTTGDQEQ